MTYEMIKAKLDRAIRLVHNDHKQRWIYRDVKGTHITDKPVPYKDAVSVRWLDGSQCVEWAFRPRLLAHNAMGGVT